MTGVRSKLLAAALLVLLSVAPAASAAAAPAAEGSPLAAVRAYVRALDHRRPHKVCATFAPALRRWMIRAGEFGSGRTCAEVVHENFQYDRQITRPMWLRASIERIDAVQRYAATGVTALTLTLGERYICVGRRHARGCKATVEHRLQTLYLSRVAGRWLLVKPGSLLRDLVSGGSLLVRFVDYPPATALTASMPASFPAPAFSCAAPAAAASALPGDLRGDHHVAVDAPWLEVLRFGFAPSDGGICFSLELAAPPRPDSLYAVKLLPPSAPSEPAPVTLLGVSVDGVGELHAVPAGGSIEAGLDGNTVEIFLPARPATLTSFFAQGVAFGLQYQEPLIAHPLNAADLVPRDACLTYPGGAIQARGCEEEEGP